MCSELAIRTTCGNGICLVQIWPPERVATLIDTIDILQQARVGGGALGIQLILVILNRVIIVFPNCVAMLLRVRVLWGLIILVEYKKRSTVVNGIAVPCFEVNQRVRFFTLRACGSIPVRVGKSHKEKERE